MFGQGLLGSSSPIAAMAVLLSCVRWLHVFTYMPVHCAMPDCHACLGMPVLRLPASCCTSFVCKAITTTHIPRPVQFAASCSSYQCFVISKFATLVKLDHQIPGAEDEGINVLLPLFSLPFSNSTLFLQAITTLTPHLSRCLFLPIELCNEDRQCITGLWISC